MSSERERIQARVDEVPVWFHAIEVGEGVVTPGHRFWDLDSLGVGDLSGKTVLDIGAWDGYFSFSAEQRGAARVVALDDYVWSLDLRGWERHQARRATEQRPPESAREVEGLWRPEELPGKRGFDTAHQLLGSTVEPVVADFMEADLESLGSFDVVLYLGVLYHMENPLAALRRLRTVTEGLAVIETECVRLEGVDGRPVCEFFPAAELASDPSNWWAPNREAVVALCTAAGFSEVRVAASSEDFAARSDDGATRYRLVAHARP